MSALEELREIVATERMTLGGLSPEAWPLLGALAVVEELAKVGDVLRGVEDRLLEIRNGR